MSLPIISELAFMMRMSSLVPRSASLGQSSGARSSEQLPGRWALNRTTQSAESMKLPRFLPL